MQRLSQGNKGNVPIPAPKPGKIPKDRDQATGNPAKLGRPWKKLNFINIFSQTFHYNFSKISSKFSNLIKSF